MKNEKLNSYVEKVVARCEEFYLHLNKKQVSILASYLEKYHVKNDSFIILYPIVYRDSFGQLISCSADETTETIPLDSNRAIIEGCDVAETLFD